MVRHTNCSDQKRRFGAFFIVCVFSGIDIKAGPALSAIRVRGTTRSHCELRGNQDPPANPSYARVASVPAVMAQVHPLPAIQDKDPLPPQCSSCWIKDLCAECPASILVYRKDNILKSCERKRVKIEYLIRDLIKNGEVG